MIENKFFQRPIFHLLLFIITFVTTVIAGTEYPTNEKVVKTIKEISRLRYGRDRNLVEKDINDRSKSN